MENIKSAIIIGATGGIGKAVTQYLDAQNVSLLLVAQHQERLEILTSELQHVHTYEALDIMDESALKKLISSFYEKEKRIDLLFNTAGYVKRGTSTLDKNEFIKMLNINLIGVFNAVQAVIPYMKQQKYGKIINLSSISGKIARAPLGGYAASKFGLVGLNEALHKELAPLGIDVTAICPNLVDTEMTSDVTMPREKMLSTQDIVETLKFILQLSSSVSLKEVILQCKTKVIENEGY